MITSILSDGTFAKLNKTSKNFIVNALWHILAIKGKINFLQLAVATDVENIGRVWPKLQNGDWIFVALRRLTPISRKLYFSTETKLCAEKLVGNYRSRFQIEFLYRDAKQFTGLTNCQARDQNKLDFHFNASLSAVNLARFDCLSTHAGEGKAFSMSDYKTHAHNTLLLERFINKFAINPNLAKNQKIINELLDYGKIAA